MLKPRLSNGNYEIRTQDNFKASIREYGPRVARIALCCLLGALLVEVLTLFGSPFTSVLDFSAWSKTRIAITWIALFILFGLYRAAAAKLPREKQEKTGMIRYLKGICYALLPSICILLALLAAKYITHIAIAVPAIAIIAAMTFSVLSVVSLRGYLADKPQKIYLPVGMAFSLVFCFLAPVDTCVSWDDQIHYDRAIAVSYLISPEYTEADRVMLYPEPVIGYGNYSAPTEGYIAYVCSLEELSGVEFEKCTGFVSSFGFNTLSYQAVGYLPAAFGLWLARLFHLPFAVSFCTGRLFNSLFFLMLVYLGIRRLRAGKATAIVFALLPTVVFLSASYSYDPWCIGWLLYGFLRYISWHQNSSFKMTWREVAIVVFAFVVGCGPKAIYFPIFFILLFVPRGFFSSKKQMKRYRAVVVGASIAVLATFLAPFLCNGPGSGDDRGGSDVDSTGQVSWILDNPISFAYVITSFLKDYLSPADSVNYTDLIAYLSQPSLCAFPLAALLIFAVVDNGEDTRSYSSLKYKVAAVLLLVGTAALISIALYVSFTPVGHYTVNGCQERYLLPLIMPALMLGLNVKSTYEGSRKALNGAAFSVAIAFNAWACFHSIVHVYT